MSHVPYRRLPIDLTDVGYEHGPDSTRRDGVPPGETISFEWRDSAIYPGTSRTVWIHVPAGHDPNGPAALTVFQDGWWYLDPDGDLRGGIVLDNLVHGGEIPNMIGVFVDPGIFEGAAEPKNRNAEYDAFDDRYLRFLLEEILPEVTRRHSISDDPEHWAICGGSSGGDCALTAAWLRPDRFRRVIGFNSSFAQIPGGNPYPKLIAETPTKPLRIFLQAAHRDIGWNKAEWNWLAENLEVAAALARAGYDFRLVLGDNGHDTGFCGAILPDALRWIWRD